MLLLSLTVYDFLPRAPNQDMPQIRTCPKLGWFTLIQNYTNRFLQLVSIWDQCCRERDWCLCHSSRLHRREGGKQEMNGRYVAVVEGGKGGWVERRNDSGMRKWEEYIQATKMHQC